MANNITTSSYQYPALHRAANEMAIGGGAPQRLDKFEFEVSPADAASADAQLAALNEKDFDTFTCGENDDMQAIADRSAWLQATMDFLTVIFDQLPTGSVAYNPETGRVELQGN